MASTCPNFSLPVYRKLVNEHGRDAVYILHEITSSPEFQLWNGGKSINIQDGVIVSEYGEEWDISNILETFGDLDVTAAIRRFVPGSVYGSDIKNVLKNLLVGANEETKLIINALLDRVDLVSDVKVLMKDVIEPTRDPSRDAFGTYSSSIDDEGGLIKLSFYKLRGKSVDGVRHVILHEIIHAYTFEIIAANPETLSEPEKQFVNGVITLFNITKKRLEKEGIDTSGIYAFKNESEFVAELLSSLSFREQIRSIDPDQTIFQRFLSLVKKLLGIDNTQYVKEINEILSYIGGASRALTYSNDWVGLAFLEANAEPLTKSQKVQKEIIRSLERRIFEYQQSTEPEQKRREGRLRVEARKLTEQYEAEQEKDILLSAIDFALSEIRTITEDLANAEANNAVNLTFLEGMIRHLSAFNYLKDIKGLMINSKLSEDPRFSEGVIEVIDTLLNQVGRLQEKYKEYSIRINAENLGADNRKVEKDYQIRYENEFGTFEERRNEYPTRDEYLAARAKYVSEQMSENVDEIEFKKREQIDELLREGTVDIGIVATYLHPAQHSEDQLLAMTKQLLDEVADSSRRQYNEKERLIHKLWKALFEFKGKTNNPQDLYEEILERDSDGKLTQYYVSKYRLGEFERESERFWESLEDVTDPVERNQIIRAWYNANYENEWTDEFYDKIKDIFPDKTEEWEKANEKIKDLLRPHKKDDGTYDFTTLSIGEWEYLNSLYAERDKYRVKLTKDKYDALQAIADFIETDAFKETKKHMEDTLSPDEYAKWLEQQYVVTPGNRKILLPIWRTIIPKDKKKYSNPFYEGPNTLHHKWLNPQYDSLMALDDSNPVKAFYNEIIRLQEEADLGRPRYKKLGYRLPGVRKGKRERLYSGDISFESMSEAWRENFKKEVDDEEFGLVGEDGQTVYEDAEGNVRRFVPLFYTSKVEPENQSYDIASIALKNEYTTISYKNTIRIVPQLESLRRIIADRPIKDTDAKGRLRRLMDKSVRTVDGTSSNIMTAYNNMLEKYVYGIKYHDQMLLGMDAKFWQTFQHYNSILLLGGNVTTGATNVTLGQILLAIEAIPGNKIGRGSWLKAYRRYGADLTDILGDAGQSISKARTNLLDEEFDALNHFGGPRYDFLENRYLKRTLGNLGAFYIINNMGEHFMQMMTLHAVLDDIKVLDADGNYINHSGNSSDRSSGMSLNDAYSTDEPGKLKLHEKVAKVEFNGRILDYNESTKSRITNYVRDLNEHLHGAYSEQNKGEVQRYILGRLFFQMRGWLIPGLRKRWKGISWTNIRNNVSNPHYNYQRDEYEEGQYVVFLRYFVSLVRKSDSLGYSIAGKWKDMTEEERAAVLRSMLEAGSAMILIFLAGAMIEAAKDLDDEDDDAEYWTAYYLIRLQSELQFYYWAPDTLAILRSPMAVMSTFEAIMRLAKLSMPWNWDEEYEKGWRKGQPKAQKRIEDLLPVYRHLLTLKHADESIAFFNWGE